MYTSTVLFAIVASFVGFVVATPPACLIAAVEMQANPSDYKSICGSLEPAMVGNMTESCSPANKQAAISAYSSLCLAQGVTVSIQSSVPSSTKTGTNPSPTGTPGSLTTGAGLTAATGTPTGSGAATSSTGKNAGPTMAPQGGFLIAPILLGASFVGQYLL